MLVGTILLSVERQKMAEVDILPPASYLRFSLVQVIICCSIFVCVGIVSKTRCKVNEMKWLVSSYDY